MSTAQNTRPPGGRKPSLPPLENGDRLDQKTFHARYEAMPSHVRAELIGGIVYMASPQKKPHGRFEVRLMRWLDEYEEATPRTAVFVNTTNILGVSVRNYSGFSNVLVRDSNNPDTPGFLRSSAFGQPVTSAGGVFGSGGPRAFQFGLRATF